MSLTQSILAADGVSHDDIWTAAAVMVRDMGVERGACYRLDTKQQQVRDGNDLIVYSHD